MSPPPPAHNYHDRIRLPRKISFVTSFTIFKRLRKYYSVLTLTGKESIIRFKWFTFGVSVCLLLNHLIYTNHAFH